jgi:6,7-dimethyl-8-ribityllumazine synthase
MLSNKGSFKPSNTSRKAKYAIASTSWNSEIVEKMLENCLNYLSTNGVKSKNIRTIKVPGVFELPSIANKLAYDVDAIIALGCVIKGETPHFDFISNSCAHGLTKVSIEKEIPVIFGILTTNNQKQAEDRANPSKGNKGAEAAETAMEMVERFSSLRK